MVTVSASLSTVVEVSWIVEVPLGVVMDWLKDEVVVSSSVVLSKRVVLIVEFESSVLSTPVPIIFQKVSLYYLFICIFILLSRESDQSAITSSHRSC